MDTSPKVRINGLKTSGPYFAVWIDRSEAQPDMISGFCRALTGLRANMAFVAAARTGGKEPFLCCIDPVDRPKVATLVERDPGLRSNVRFGQTALGLLSIYPHQSSLQVMGLAIETLSRKDFAFYGLASSIAALTFVVDFERMQEIAAAFSAEMTLPVDPSTVQAQIMVRQIPPGR